MSDLQVPQVIAFMEYCIIFIFPQHIAILTNIINIEHLLDSKLNP